MSRNSELTGQFHKSVGGYFYLFQKANGRWYFADKLTAIMAFTQMDERGIKPQRCDPDVLKRAFKKHGATSTAYHSFPEIKV